MCARSGPASYDDRTSGAADQELKSVLNLVMLEVVGLGRVGGYADINVESDMVRLNMEFSTYQMIFHQTSDYSPCPGE
eukprot:308551-Amorphochlora_amoeboformis.AAC.2